MFFTLFMYSVFLIVTLSVYFTMKPTSLYVDGSILGVRISNDYIEDEDILVLTRAYRRKMIHIFIFSLLAGFLLFIDIDVEWLYMTLFLLVTFTPILLLSELYNKYNRKLEILLWKKSGEFNFTVDHSERFDIVEVKMKKKKLHFHLLAILGLQSSAIIVLFQLSELTEIIPYWLAVSVGFLLGLLMMYTIFYRDRPRRYSKNKEINQYCNENKRFRRLIYILTIGYIQAAISLIFILLERFHVINALNYMLMILLLIDVVLLFGIIPMEMSIIRDIQKVKKYEQRGMVGPEILKLIGIYDDKRRIFKKSDSGIGYRLNRSNGKAQILKYLGWIFAGNLLAVFIFVVIFSETIQYHCFFGNKEVHVKAPPYSMMIANREIQEVELLSDIHLENLQAVNGIKGNRRRHGIYRFNGKEVEVYLYDRGPYIQIKTKDRTIYINRPEKTETLQLYKNFKRIIGS